MTERQFADNFLVYFFDGVDQYPWRRWSKPANVEALIEIIRPYIFNSKFDSSCKIKIINKTFQLNIEESRNYSRFKDAFLRGKLYVCFFTVAQKFQMAYTTTCSQKYHAAVKLVEEILERGEKVIIFVKYIAEALSLRESTGGLLYTGKYKDDLARFEGDENVLICTYGVGSVGLNLQCANNLIFYSQTFDFKEKEQAKYRIYRIGQQRSVNIYNLWVDTKLEEIIRKNLSKKGNLLRDIERVISAKEARKL